MSGSSGFEGMVRARVVSEDIQISRQIPVTPATYTHPIAGSIETFNFHNSFNPNGTRNSYLEQAIRVSSQDNTPENQNRASLRTHVGESNNIYEASLRTHAGEPIVSLTFSQYSRIFDPEPGDQQDQHNAPSSDVNEASQNSNDEGPNCLGDGDLMFEMDT